MPIEGSEAPFATDLRPAAALFHGLSDPTRLAILRCLAEGEARVAELVAASGLPQSTVSTHLACLRDCGLVTSRPRGRASLYALARTELLDVLRSAEALLAITGDAVALCPTYGTAGAADTDDRPTDGVRHPESAESEEEQ